MEVDQACSSSEATSSTGSGASTPVVVTAEEKPINEAPPPSLTSTKTGSTLTVNNLRQFNNEQEARDGREWFQFGCPDCRELWWRYLPPGRPSSRCTRCHSTYQAVPRDQMIGYGRFSCDRCGQVWTNHRSMYKFDQPCRRCSKWVFADTPPGIGPRMRHLPRPNTRSVSSSGGAGRGGGKGRRPPAGYDQHNCRCCFNGKDDCSSMPVSGLCADYSLASTALSRHGRPGSAARRVGIDPVSLKDFVAFVPK